MNGRRILAVAVAGLALAHVLAAGGAACCATAVPAKPHACCGSRVMAPTAAPKGCCKAPVAPRPEAGGNDAVPPAPETVAAAWGGDTLAGGAIPPAAAVRLARLDHRASSPEDSPPDVLSRTQSLLI